jgi:hypothetical protein
MSLSGRKGGKGKRKITLLVKNIKDIEYTCACISFFNCLSLQNDSLGITSAHYRFVQCLICEVFYYKLIAYLEGTYKVDELCP